MRDIHDVLRWANRTAVAQEITRRGYRVSGETLNRWYRQRSEVPAVVEHIVFDLFGIGPDTAKEPPPWAEAMHEELLTTIRGVGLTNGERAALRAIDATAKPTPEADADPTETGTQAPARTRRRTPPRDQSAQR